MTFNATLGSTLATSYITVAKADAVWSNTLNDAARAALTETEKEQSLMAATTALERRR